jgi:DNA polymerase-4
MYNLLMTRKILHLDLDAFFCSVEEILDPSLKGKPFAVAGRPEHRGVVSSCSYAARKFGIHSAMPTSRALSLFPQLILVSGRHSNYGEYSDKVMAILDNTSPLVEKVSIDEAFLDVSDMQQSGKQIARSLQDRIRSELNLPCSIGVATNKLVAKVANDYGKTRSNSSTAPCAITVVPPGSEAGFLAPLPVQALWGIGPKSAQSLNSLGITTIGDLASMHDSDLSAFFGKTASEIRDRSRGIDNSPISLEHEAKSVSNETTFAKDVSDQPYLLEVLHQLSEKVGSRLRNSNVAGNTLQIKLRYSDFSTITRQVTLPVFTNQDSEIFAAATTLFKMHWAKGMPVRLLGVGVSGLGAPLRQLDLWEKQDGLREQQLLKAIDQLKDRYGKNIIQRAARIKPKKNDSGL